MKAYAFDLWERAEDAIKVSENNLLISPDSAASRAYYAAFYAVSALFALRGAVYRKHSAVESAVHRDLVRAGIWEKELGKNYANLIELRTTGDYGGIEHVTLAEAKEAVNMAKKILNAVKKICPEFNTKSL